MLDLAPGHQTNFSNRPAAVEIKHKRTGDLVVVAINRRAIRAICSNHVRIVQSQDLTLNLTVAAEVDLFACIADAAESDDPAAGADVAVDLKIFYRCQQDVYRNKRRKLFSLQVLKIRRQVRVTAHGD